jgi:Gig2-like
VPVTHQTPSGTLPELPHWETTPADRPAAIVQMKEALRARIEGSGRSIGEVFSVIESRARAQVDEISAATAEGRQVWPVINYVDIAAGTVSTDDLKLLRRRGCVVVRGQFPRQQALDWDQGIVDYVERNRIFEDYRGPGDDFFGSVGSKPEIYPIYWSRPQMQARQSDQMADVQRFLNEQWISESDGTQWFDATRDAMYPDRIRRRPPGTNSRGLGAHLDAGTLDLWMTTSSQRAFRHLFDGTVEQYDPWDAAHRTAGTQYASSTMCSAFRTFQGWTALSDMDHDQGVLYTVPIADAMGYVLLRPLLADVPDDDMCGVAANQVLPITEQWHSLLLAASSGIPDVRAGDTVWWHSDMIHGVAPVADQQGWGNVMYIPAAPWCPRNESYAESVRDAFLSGSSPTDFPEEHYERNWTDRFAIDDLNDIGRRGLGLTV